MKKKILILCSLSTLLFSESWLEKQNRLDKYEKEANERKQKAEDYINDYKQKTEIENRAYEDERNRRILEDKEKRERTEQQKLNEILEEDRLTPPYNFDGKVKYGDKSYINIQTSNENINVRLKEDEYKYYQYYIKNKMNVNGGCNYQRGNSYYYDCWLNFY